MADPYPSLPPHEYRASRMLRLAVFSLVVATLLVSGFIVLIQFVWDQFLAVSLDRPPYQPRLELLLPSVLLIAFVLGRLLWEPARRRGPPERLG